MKYRFFSLIAITLIHTKKIFKRVLAKWNISTSVITPPKNVSFDSELQKNGTTSAPEERKQTVFGQRIAEICPYCASKNFVKRGMRKKKRESVQLYLCRVCGKTFTAQFVKGKQYPLHVVIESLNYYYLGYSFTQTVAIMHAKHTIEIPPATISAWVEEFKEICPYDRMREYALKRFTPKDAVQVTTMAHRQIYRFRYHRAKFSLILEDFKHRNFSRLREYLESVSAETPHHYFQEGNRISEARARFNYNDVYLRAKQNYATRIARFVLQAVQENKFRHEALQRFMIATDSVTIATEVPVYITGEDIEHMSHALGFEIPGFAEWKKENKRILITGHIDFLQVRNGQVHILDYKPHADKERPIEQLTWYALALSRLTGLRLYEFVCAWFDDTHYFEFYPLHIVLKKKKVRVRKKQWNTELKVGVASPLAEVTAPPGKRRKPINVQ
ncbi:MAG: hypothetical protein LiPW41_379 [Parcubacteria group bacterium LiPW_41]|nr:MAG: hypothetical protein LiPW41_379 [Parcubacteria group bacterium LiPW_41]